MPKDNAVDDAGGPQGFYVYARKSDEWALVHRAWCRFPRQINGASGFMLRSNTGTWSGPFSSRDEAFARAQSNGLGSVRGCTYCKP